MGKVARFVLKPSRLGGFPTLQKMGFSEAFHSEIGSWEEAHQIYVDQSQFERLETLERPAVIYDIGLGIAANALAFLSALEQKRWKPSEPILLYSFETECESLEFALQQQSVFSFLTPWSFELKTLLAQGILDLSPRVPVVWTLLRGDFRGFFTQDSLPKADWMWFDLFSPSQQPDLWGVDPLGACFKKIDPQAGLWLSYSIATAVRTALLLVGFHVGEGKGTTQKKSITCASPAWNRLENPLPRDWWKKLKNSSRPFPADVLKKGKTKEELEDEIQKKLNYSLFV